MAEQRDAIGSVAEEAMKLIFALSSANSDEEKTEHVCTNSWCPLCQMVGYVREHPEALEKVTQSAADLARSVLHLIEQANLTKDAGSAATAPPKDTAPKDPQ